MNSDGNQYRIFHGISGIDFGSIKITFTLNCVHILSNAVEPLQVQTQTVYS